MWDLVEGRCLYTLEGHDGDVTAVDFNGTLIVSGSEDCSVRVWNTDTKSCQHIFSGHVDRVSCVSFYKDNFVVSGSPDGTLKLWNLQTNECTRTLHTGFAAYVWSIDVSGDYVVCGCDENIKVWNLVKGDSANTLMGHQDHVWGVQVLDECMISCSEDCTVRIWVQNEGYTNKQKKGKKKRRVVDPDSSSDDELSHFASNTNSRNNSSSNLLEFDESYSDAELASV